MNRVQNLLLFTTRLVAKNLRKQQYHLLKSFSVSSKSTLIKISAVPNVQAITNTKVRWYAKGKDKKKEKGQAQVKLNEAEFAEFVNVEKIKSQMQQCIDDMKNEFIKNLSLRSTTGSIDSLIVSFDGKDFTLQELAQIIRKNPKTLVINMGVFPQAIPAALTAIKKSGMNLNPQQDGTTLYIPIPKVTKEHRENLAKNAKMLFVKYRDCIKDVKNKEVKSLKRKKSTSEDQTRMLEQQFTVLTETYVSEAEKIFNSKTKELLGDN